MADSFSTYTVSLDADQDGILLRALDATNTARALQSLAPLSATALVQSAIEAWIASQATVQETEDIEEYRTVLRASPKSLRAQARTLLNLPVKTHGNQL